MMNNAQLAAASFDDIVFDGRNKGYGAYELRGLYQRHVSRALAIGTAIFSLLVMYPVVAMYLKDPAPVVTIKPTGPVEPMNFDPDVVTPPPPTIVTPPPPAQPTTQTRYVTFKVAKDEKVVETPPDMTALVDTKVGTTTVKGSDEPELPLDEPVAPPVTVAEATPHVGPYVSVEQMPELPGGGGVAAIVAAIQKAVRYPSRAISDGVEGRVYVSFVVNAQGEVVDIKVLKGLGSGLDEETMRAIKTLPRFIPGKQNGREVSVSYSVPVTYKIQ